MEKFRQFAHPATGINPFIPPNINVVPNRFDPLIRLAMIPLIFLKLIISLTLIPVLFIVDILPFRKLTVPIVSRGLLYSLGFFKMRRNQIDPQKLKFKIIDPLLENSLIISQYQSACDVLIVAAVAAPLNFGFIAADGNVETHRVIGALSAALNQRQPQSGSISLDSFVSNATLRDRVIFAEGARTNGTGVLAWPVNLSKMISSRPVSFSCIRYNNDSKYCANHCVGSGRDFLVNLLLGFSHSASLSFAQGVVCDDPRRLFVRLASIGRLEAVADSDLDVETYEKFQHAWRKIYKQD